LLAEPGDPALGMGGDNSALAAFPVAVCGPPALLAASTATIKDTKGTKKESLRFMRLLFHLWRQGIRQDEHGKKAPVRQCLINVTLSSLPAQRLFGYDFLSHSSGAPKSDGCCFQSENPAG
jgi:hypothetical protein